MVPFEVRALTSASSPRPSVALRGESFGMAQNCARSYRITVAPRARILAARRGLSPFPSSGMGTVPLLFLIGAVP